MPVVNGEVLMLPSFRPQCRIERADYRDFLDSLAQGSVDLILTDPPYAISRKTGFKNLGQRSVERFAVSMDFGEWDHAEIDLVALATKSWRVLRKGGTLIVFYDLWKIERLKDALECAGFSMIRLIIWQKTNPVPLNAKRTYLSNSREVAVVGVKGGKPTFNANYHNGVYAYPIPRHNGKRIHPTQKPEKLISDLIRVHSHEGDLIVDPFFGGGGGVFFFFFNLVVITIPDTQEGEVG
ncbi:MAG: site-specific DNA-methyltransferase [Chloroflexi bacterium]|nr:site-specific DNA-methyltransferase [Chloroflexota bacterium]